MALAHQMNLVVAGLAGVLAGLCLSPLVLQSVEPLAQEVALRPDPQGSAQLAAARTLEALREEVHQITDSLAEMAARERDVPGVRTPVETQGAEGDRLSSETLRRLDEVLLELNRSARLTSSRRRLVLPTGPPATVPPASGAPGVSDTLASLILMDYQKVLDLYGVPQLVIPGEGGKITWTYTAADDSMLLLHFADGLVYEYAR